MSASPIKKNRVNIVPMVRLISCSCPAPMYWAIRMVPPMVIPVTMLLTSTMIWLPIETAVMPAASVNQPTTIISTVPYSAWMKLASKKGRCV